jgi:DNA-binding response OmpR family regulator
MARENDKPTVVMVDDEKDFLDIVGRWASPEYEFVGLTDGAELLAELEGLNPSLIVLDLNLPGESGFSLCRRVRADRRFDAVPVLFLTGSREDEDFLRNMRAGGTAYVTKPIGRRQLLALFGELTGAGVEAVDTAASD